jgi:hypothetical protein
MQPLAPGWYWDPGLRPGMFCWWDGHEWTQHLSARRDSAAPEAMRLPTPINGRYVAGGLSFPALEGWSACPGYPDIVDVQGQELVVGKTPRGPYVATVFVGGLPNKYGVDLHSAGSAFADEMLYMYYPHEKPHAGLDPHLEPVLGRPGWVLAVPLDVEDPALDFLEEDALIVVLDTPSGLGVLFASLPHVGPPVPAVGDVLATLRLSA